MPHRHPLIHRQVATRAERRSFSTWGYVSDEPTEVERNAAARKASKRLGREVTLPAIPRIDEQLAGSRGEHLRHLNAGRLQGAHPLQFRAQLRVIVVAVPVQPQGPQPAAQGRSIAVSSIAVQRCPRVPPSQAGNEEGVSP